MSCETDKADLRGVIIIMISEMLIKDFDQRRLLLLWLSYMMYKRSQWTTLPWVVIVEDEFDSRRDVGEDVDDEQDD